MSLVVKGIIWPFRRLFDPVKASTFCDIPALCH